MQKVRHVNDGKCPKCKEILDKFPGFDEQIRKWFEDMQSRVKDCHVSYAGRGKKDQELFFKQGTSKARWGESPHNYNVAVDLFRLIVTGAEFSRQWYTDVVKPEIAKVDFLEWGGDWVRWKDFPHVELKGWAKLKAEGKLKLVE